MDSSDGLRNLAASRPESACSLSRDGEGLSDLDGVVVGKGSLEAGRGIPLGRVGVLGCLSMAVTLAAFQRSGGDGHEIRGRQPRALSVQNRSQRRSTQGALCCREGKSKKQTWSQQSLSLEEFLFTAAGA